MYGPGWHSPQLLAICVTSGKCRPSPSLSFLMSTMRQTVQKLLALIPSWCLQKRKTLSDPVPNKERTPVCPSPKQNQACHTSFHSPEQTLSRRGQRDGGPQTPTWENSDS